MWTIKEAQEYLRTIYDRIQAANFHTGIIGSVATFGVSQNDLDIVILRYINERDNDYANLIKYLTDLGAIKYINPEYGGSNPAFDIYKLTLPDGKVIDFFIY